MKAIVEVDTTCCDDCPFLQYTVDMDLCVLSEDSIGYPFAFSNIPCDCPLLVLDRIKYSNVKVIE